MLSILYKNDNTNNMYLVSRLDNDVPVSSDTTSVPIVTLTARAISGCEIVNAADQEIEQAETEVNTLQYNNAVQLTEPDAVHNEQVLAAMSIDDMFAQPEQDGDFEILFGSNVCPRFSCACHKLNLAVR